MAATIYFILNLIELLIWLVAPGDKWSLYVIDPYTTVKGMGHLVLYIFSPHILE